MLPFLEKAGTGHEEAEEIHFGVCGIIYKMGRLKLIYFAKRGDLGTT